MESQASCNGVLQLLIQFLLLSIALGDETLSKLKQVYSNSMIVIKSSTQICLIMMNLIDITGCKMGGVFFSLNRTLAPLDMVTASDDTSNFGYEDGRFFKTWCTTDFDPDPFIEMELTSPVLITQILFSGSSTLSGSYHVTNLTLEYSPSNSSTVLSYYTTETGSIKVRFHLEYRPVSSYKLISEKPAK